MLPYESFKQVSEEFSVEKESNRKNSRTDGSNAGPDPKVQREIKNYGVLHRAAMMKLGMEKKVTESEEAPRKIRGPGYAEHIKTRRELNKSARSRGFRNYKEMEPPEQVDESLPEYAGTVASKTGANQTQDYKRNPNFRKPKSGSTGDGFYRDGNQENSSRVKTGDGSTM